MNQHERLVLAFCIAEHQTLLDHVEALAKVGQPVPPTAVHSLRAEHLWLCLKWHADARRTEFTHEQVPSVVEEARRYCTDNQSRLDELLNRE